MSEHPASQWLHKVDTLTHNELENGPLISKVGISDLQRQNDHAVVVALASADRRLARS